MSDKSRLILAVIDIAAWGVGLWLVQASADPMARAKVHYHVAAVSRWCAHWFGRQAIDAELRYMQEVRSL